MMVFLLDFLENMWCTFYLLVLTFHLWQPTHQECHQRAWDSVASYMEANLQIFCGRALDAEATLLPSSRSWLRELSQQVGASLVDCNNLVELNAVSNFKKTVTNYIFSGSLGFERFNSFPSTELYRLEMGRTITGWFSSWIVQLLEFFRLHSDLSWWLISRTSSVTSPPTESAYWSTPTGRGNRREGHPHYLVLLFLGGSLF